MTQPPDEQPTVAWTPPETSPIEPEPAAPAPAEAATTDEPAPPAPEPDAPAPAAPATPIDAPPPAAPIDAPPPPDAAEPLSAPGAPADSTPDAQNPLISWAPSGGAAAGAAGAAAATGESGAIVGWDAPSTALPTSAVEGYQTAGVGARIVAWLLDGAILFLLSILVVIIVLVAVGPTFMDDTFATSALTAILTTGFSFLYFVGMWTSSSGATLGMRSMGLRLVQAPGPGTLGVGPAVIRWVAFGYPLSFLALVPVLSSISSWALTGWTIVLLITTAISDTNQGLHDRFAGSAVLRRIGAGSGWAVAGCLIIVGLLIVLPFILFAVVLASAPPEFWEEFQRQMQIQMEQQS